MTDLVEHIRRLAATGATPAAIAAQIGKSRQWVYTICNHNNIIYSGRTNRIPETLTGGIRVPLKSRISGAIAELLAAADLMARGYEVYRPIINTHGFDLIAVKNDTMTSIEVRTAWRKADGKMTLPFKSTSQAQHHAFVIAGEPVLYKPPLA
jgi:hypothetical protein